MPKSEFEKLGFAYDLISFTIADDYIIKCASGFPELVLSTGKNFIAYIAEGQSKIFSLSQTFHALGHMECDHLIRNRRH